MKAQCIICSELFLSACDVSATPCGHTFHQECLNEWLGRSKTCPHCRAKVFKKEVIPKLYFDCGPDADAEEDPDALRNKNNELQVELMETKQEVAGLMQTIQTDSHMHEATVKKLGSLQSSLFTEQQTNAALKMQLAHLSKENQKMAACEKEIVSLKAKVKQYSHVEVMLNGATKEMNEILERYSGATNCKNCKDIVSYCAVLKQNYMETIKVKQDLKAREKSLVAENSRWERKSRVQEGQLSQQHLELCTANLKISNLEERVKLLVKCSNRKDLKSRAMDRLMFESPVAQHVKDAINCSLENLDSPEVAAPAKKDGNKENSIFHLPLKECSLAASIGAGIAASWRTNASLRPHSKALQTESDTSIYKNFGIMKRPTSTRLKSSTLSLKQKPQAALSEQGYNGLGGHSKPELFPAGHASQLDNRKKAKVQSDILKGTLQTHTLENYILVDATDSD